MALMIALRTDKPEAEIYLMKDGALMAEKKWLAHRQLAETLHQEIRKLLENVGLSLSDLTKVGVYQGPGSFTGLRIGVSAANALAYGLGIPVVGGSENSWLQQCIERVGSPEPVTVLYGSDPHITQQKK